MNKLFVIGTGSLIGAGLGFVIAHVLVERFMADEFEENSDIIDEEELEELKEDWKPLDVKDMKKKKNKPVDYTKKFVPSDTDKGDLAKLAAKYNQGVMDDVTNDVDNDSLLVGNLSPAIVKTDQPYLIAHEDYLRNDFNFSANALTYYSKDDVLVTDKGVPLSDVDKIVGPDALTSFENDEPVYVCNEQLRALYMIECIDEQFYKERDIRTKRRKPVKKAAEDEE